jgi:predicted DNA-binding transcriptional regulator YafY
MADVESRGWRFRPREAPDAAEYVSRAITQSPYEHVARVRVHARKELVEKVIPPSVGTVTAAGGEHCIVEAGGNDLDAMAMHLGGLPWELTVLGPPGLLDAMDRLAQRLARAVRMKP